MIAAVILFCATALPAQDGKRHRVTIDNKNYSPASITVRVGDTVTWQNSDDRDHTVTASDGSFDSGNLGTGASFSHRFIKAGEYPYRCAHHPRMKGKVVVQD